MNPNQASAVSGSEYAVRRFGSSSLMISYILLSVQGRIESASLLHHQLRYAVHNGHPESTRCLLVGCALPPPSHRNEYNHRVRTFQPVLRSFSLPSLLCSSCSRQPSKPLKATDDITRPAPSSAPPIQHVDTPRWDTRPKSQVGSCRSNAQDIGTVTGLRRETCSM